MWQAPYVILSNEDTAMRQPPSVLRTLAILLVLSFAARAYADDRAEARNHYQAGLKYYTSGDYRSAIREFSAAQQLVPADLNNYNLALCYDKLGDAEPATQYYRAFLEKQPNTDKRAEIEASISRLEAASRSATNKKAEEARKVEEARKAEEARKGEETRKAEETRKTEEARKAAEAKADDARRPAGPVLGPAPGPAAGPTLGPAPGPAAGPTLGPAPGPAAGPTPGPAPGPTLGPAPGPTAGPTPGPAAGPEPAPPVASKPHRGPAISGSIGTPSTATPVSTGDAQLDRINSINIDEIRDQRMGGTGSGSADARGGPSASANAGPARPGQPAPPGPSGANGQPMPGVPDQAPKEKPVYKKWWFWAVVAVSGYVVYELATTSSTPSRSAREAPPTGRANAQPGGLTLLRW
jgi:hypothetical protein